MRFFSNPEDLSREAIAAYAVEEFNINLSRKDILGLDNNNNKLLQDSIKILLKEYKHHEIRVDNSLDGDIREFHFRKQSDVRIKEFGEKIGMDIFSSINENLQNINIAQEIKNLIKDKEKYKSRYPFSDLGLIVSSSMNDTRGRTIPEAIPEAKHAEMISNARKIPRSGHGIPEEKTDILAYLPSAPTHQSKLKENKSFTERAISKALQDFGI